MRPIGLCVRLNPHAKALREINDFVGVVGLWVEASHLRPNRTPGGLSGFGARNFAYPGSKESFLWPFARLGRWQTRSFDWEENMRCSCISLRPVSWHDPHTGWLHCGFSAFRPPGFSAFGLSALRRISWRARLALLIHGLNPK